MVEVAVEIQVLRFYVEHDAVFGQVVDQGAVAFITLGDEVFAVGVPVGVGPQHGNLGADVVAGAHATLAEQVRRQR